MVSKVLALAYIHLFLYIPTSWANTSTFMDDDSKILIFNLAWFPKLWNPIFHFLLVILECPIDIQTHYPKPKLIPISFIGAMLSSP